MGSQFNMEQNNKALSLLVFFLVMAVLIPILPPNLFAQSSDEGLLMALSNRDSVPPLADLEKLAGGQDALVQKLLQYRRQEEPPFVAIRAEKLLLSYSDRPEVKAALLDDISSTQYLGLARVVTMHIDKVKDEATRQELAKVALSRAKSDSSFAPYARTLHSSTNAEIKKMAEESVPRQ